VCGKKMLGWESLESGAPSIHGIVQVWCDFMPVRPGFGGTLPHSCEKPPLSQRFLTSVPSLSWQNDRVEMKMASQKEALSAPG
jgi:hypothetical protein